MKRIHPFKHSCQLCNVLLNWSPIKNQETSVVDYYPVYYQSLRPLTHFNTHQRDVNSLDVRQHNLYLMKALPRDISLARVSWVGDPERTLLTLVIDPIPERHVQAVVTAALSPHLIHVTYGTKHTNTSCLSKNRLIKRAFTPYWFGAVFLNFATFSPLFGLVWTVSTLNNALWFAQKVWSQSISICTVVRFAAGELTVRNKHRKRPRGMNQRHALLLVVWLWAFDKMHVIS